MKILKGYRLIAAYLLTIMIMLLWLCGCRTQYVPVETVRTEYRDRFFHDSVFINTVQHDSVVLKQQGDTVFVDRWHTIYKDRWREQLRIDSFIKVDSVQVPYPVERQLSKWEQFTLNYGAMAIGGSFIAILLVLLEIIRWLRRKRE